MADRTCSIDGCAAKHFALGWCRSHYRRWRKHGDPIAGSIRRGSHATCSLVDCERPHKAHGWCEMHWERVKRRGTTDPPQSDIRICSHIDCVREHWALDYCRLHYRRFKAHGDPTKVSLAMRYGDDVGYQAVHARLAKYRGSATRHNCVDCDHPAHHWSYDNADANERCSSDGHRFSIDLEHYEPRCRSCHKMFDNNYGGALSVQQDCNSGSPI